MFVSFIRSAIQLSATFLYGSVGEIITEKSGHLNLGIPGIMCIGAVGGCIGVDWYVNASGGSPAAALVVLISILFAVVFSAAAGLIYCFLVDTLRVNQNVTGLALTTFGIGFSKYFYTSIKVSNLSSVGGYFNTLFPFAEDLGWFGQIFLSYGILVYLSIAIALVASFVFKRTKAGLYLRAVGESPATADAAGINVTGYKYVATLIGSAIAGLGGLSYMMDFMSGMSGKIVVDTFGWMCVALVIFVVWKPNFAILGSIIFSACYVLPNFTTVSTSMREIFKMLPYVVTIVALIITSIIGKREVQPPQALGLPYFREDR